MDFDGKLLENLSVIADVIAMAFKNGGKVYAMGNGGSLCDAMHFCEELSGKFKNDRRPLPALAIADPAYLTCVGNDYGFEFVFSRFIEAFADADDIIIAISTSGKSQNILNGMETARCNGATVVGLTCQNPPIFFKKKCDFIISVVEADSSGPVQEMHIRCLHKLVELIERRLGLC